MNILKGFLKGWNATKIKNDLRDKFNNAKINRRIVAKFMTFLRKRISEYYKYIYDKQSISTENQRKTYAIDESKFTTKNNILIWVVVIINTVNKNDTKWNTKRIPNTHFMKSFIKKFIKKSNIIISDRWNPDDFFKWSKLLIYKFSFYSWKSIVGYR